MKTIGEIIHTMRVDAKLTKTALANEIGVLGQTVGNWEHDISLPNAIQLMGMADVFGCTIDEICGMDAPDDEVVEENQGTIPNTMWGEFNDTSLKSQKFRCIFCGGMAYYPQPTRLKGWVRHCPYKYCPNCGKNMQEVEYVNM